MNTITINGYKKFSGQYSRAMSFINNESLSGFVGHKPIQVSKNEFNDIVDCYKKDHDIKQSQDCENLYYLDIQRENREVRLLLELI